MTEWVSARGAAEILGTAGISRSVARRILATGLVGEPVVTAGASLYDAERVRNLLRRPSVDVDHLPPPSDRVILEIRVAAGSTPDAWRVLGNAGAIVRVHLTLLIERHSFVPVVNTCCGFVLGGYEAVGVAALAGDGGRAATRSLLQLQPPGAWFSHFANRRLHSTAGNPWRLWTLQGLGLQPGAA